MYVVKWTQKRAFANEKCTAHNFENCQLHLFSARNRFWTIRYSYYSNKEGCLCNSVRNWDEMIPCSRCKNIHWSQCIQWKGKNRALHEWRLRSCTASKTVSTYIDIFLSLNVCSLWINSLTVEHIWNYLEDNFQEKGVKWDWRKIYKLTSRMQRFQNFQAIIRSKIERKKKVIWKR